MHYTLTSRVAGAPKAKYIRRIIISVWEEPDALLRFWSLVHSRPVRTKPVVAIKVLVTLLKLCQQGPAEVMLSLIHHTPYTIHHTPYTIHHTPYTIHHTLYTIHSLYTIHHTLYSYTVHSYRSCCHSPYTICTLYRSCCHYTHTLYTIHYTHTTTRSCCHSPYTICTLHTHHTPSVHCTGHGVTQLAAVHESARSHQECVGYWQWSCVGYWIHWSSVGGGCCPLFSAIV
jgi:hypothetical protein